MTPAARREAVAVLVSHYEMSERRACRVIAADRSSVRYASRRPDDAALRARMRELAHDRRRFGYRRLHVLLKTEGLNEHLFRDLSHARAVIGAWVRDGNTRRPHSALGDLTPAAFAAACAPQRAQPPPAQMSTLTRPAPAQTG